MERVVTRILNALGFKAKKEDSTPPRKNCDYATNC